MQLSSGTQIPDGLLADIALGNEKPRLGVPSRNPALHQGFGFAISSTSLGMIGPLYDTRIGCRYTGKERDTESGLDYFGARYYGSSMGRFMSPDWSPDAEAVPYAKLDDPQSLNLYAYVGNNPLIRVDADGHCWPDFLCNFFTEVKNKVLHGEFTTDTSAAKIHQLVREDAQNRARSQYMEQLKSHPPEIRYGVVFTPFTLQFIGELGRPSFIPKDWNVTDPGRGRREGLKFQDPNNPHNNVRIMKGDPNSSNPGQQKDYMVIRKNGQTLDANGNPSNDPLDFHVPVGEELPPDLFGPLP